jgi:peptidoglycan hydrolase CwlO-like protein
MFRYLEDQENKTNEAARISKELSEQKQLLIDEISELNKKMQETDTDMRKVEDQLDSYKRKIRF